MTAFFKKHRTLAAWTAVLLAAGTMNISAQEVVVLSQFKPQVVSAGMKVVYELTIQGTQENIKGRLPLVSGIEISSNPFASRGVKIINGVHSVNITYTFPVQTKSEGEFTIPTWNIEVAGKSYPVPAAKLKVVPPGKELQQTVILQLKRPRETFFVGESVPCLLKLQIRSDVRYRLLAVPEKLGDAFIQSDLSEKPNATRERRGNQEYDTFVWPLTITALKAGTENLSFQVKLIIEKPRPKKRSTGFFDDFFSDSLFNRNRGQEVIVHTGDTPIKVLELPAQDRPDSFTGAIGLLNMRTRLSDNDVQVGEPITLTIEISGEGNFERIPAPRLEENENFKVYPSKSQFVATDNIGWKGTKFFEYILIPQTEQIGEIPPVAFNFFEPNVRQYIDLTTEALPLSVSPAPPETLAVTPQTFARLVEPAPAEEEPAAPPALLPLQLLPGSWVQGIVPAFRNALFLGGQLIPPFLIASVILMRRRRLRLQSDSVYARGVRGGKRVRYWHRKARQAIVGQDAEAFFEAAHRAIQESVGKRLKHRPDTLTLSEVETILDDCHAGTDVRESIREFFEAAYSIKFAGSPARNYDLREREKSLVNLLNTLESLR